MFKAGKRYIFPTGNIFKVLFVDDLTVYVEYENTGFRTDYLIHSISAREYVEPVTRTVLLYLVKYKRADGVFGEPCVTMNPPHVSHVVLGSTEVTLVEGQFAGDNHE